MCKKDKYRPSRYLHWMNLDTGVVLYNSLEGVASIKKYPNEQKNEVIEYLLKKEIEYEPGYLLDSLIENRYVVPTAYDEISFLNNLYMKCVNSSILHLIILPTEQCNFRCRYCYEDFKRGCMSDELMDAIIKYVRINITKYTGLKVSWFGGEPSLEIDKICKMSNKFIQICKTAKRKYWANITSNGFLINLENFKKLYDAHVFTFQITIDGIERTHDQQRILRNGGKSFEKIINNLLCIKENSECKHWHITIRTNFSKPIYEHIEEYILFYDNHFGGDDRFSFLFRPAGDWGGNSVKMYSENLLQEKGFSEVFKKMLGQPMTLDISRQLTFLNPGGSVCMASCNSTYLIDSSGNIRKCSCHLDDERNSIGVVKLDGTFQIDNYKYCSWIQNRMNAGKCNDCFYLPACLNASCPADYVLSRSDPDQCHVYEKLYLDYILAIYDKQGKIPEVTRCGK